MSQRLTPIKRRELIKRFNRLGWQGPFPGGNHQYMKKQGRKVPIPSHPEVDAGQLRDIMREADISRDEWLAAASGPSLK